MDMAKICSKMMHRLQDKLDTSQWETSSFYYCGIYTEAVVACGSLAFETNSPKVLGCLW